VPIGLALVHMKIRCSLTSSSPRLLPASAFLRSIYHLALREESRRIAAQQLEKRALRDRPNWQRQRRRNSKRERLLRSQLDHIQGQDEMALTMGQTPK
jgi:CRISPR/Cas system-associated endonuclease Cas1